MTFVDEGEQQFKNIARAVRVFSVMVQPPAETRDKEPAPDQAGAFSKYTAAEVSSSYPSPRFAGQEPALVVLPFTFSGDSPDGD